MRSGTTRAAFGKELNHDVGSPIGASSKTPLSSSNRSKRLIAGASRGELGKPRRLHDEDGDRSRGQSLSDAPAFKASSCASMRGVRVIALSSATNFDKTTPAVLPKVAGRGHISVSRGLMKAVFLATADSGAAVTPGLAFRGWGLPWTAFPALNRAAAPGVGTSARVTLPQEPRSTH